MDDAEKRDLLDREHLRLLTLFYYVAGGTNALFCLFPLIYVAMGLVFALMPAHSAGRGEPPPQIVGWMLVLFGLVFTTLLAGGAVLKFLAARALSRRRSRGLVFFAAAVTCLGFPYGTALGVFTFIVLYRESVAKQFEPGEAPAPSPQAPAAGS